MRDYLLRARSTSGEWVYGRAGEDIRQWITAERKKAADLPTLDGDSLTQYTGFEDELGVPIYEGDIVEIKSYATHPKRVLGSFRRVVTWNKYESRFMAGRFCMTCHPNMTVVGNKFDNPDIATERNTSYLNDETS